MAIIRQIILSIEELIEATFGRRFMFEPEGAAKPGRRTSRTVRRIVRPAGSW
jgi:hypothetical protein